MSLPRETGESILSERIQATHHLAKASTYRILREESFETWTQTSW